MTVEVERLVATLEANITGFQRQLDRATGGFDRRAREIEKRNQLLAQQLKQGMTKSAEAAGQGFTVMLGGIQTAIAAVAGSAVLGGLGRMASAYGTMQNSLKATGLDAAQTARVFEQLTEIAQKHGASLSEMVATYSQLAPLTKQLGVSAESLMHVMNGIGVAFRVGGQSAEAQNRALAQMSQMLNGTKIEWEDTKELLDSGRTILDAVALGLEEAGGELGKLTRLIKEGKVSSRAFYEALIVGSRQMERRLAALEGTPAQAINRVSNELAILTGETDKALGASKSLADGMNTIARFMATYRAEIVSTLAAIGSALSQAAQALNVYQVAMQAARKARELLGLPVPQAPLVPTRLPSTLQEPGQTVSLRQFPVEGAGGGRSRAPRASEYERERKALIEKIKALDLEAQTIGKTAEEVAYLTAKTELLNAAQEDGKPITEAQRAAIEALARQYSTATQAVKNLEDAQQSMETRMKALNDAFETFGQMAADAFYDMAVEGKSFNDVLKDMQKQLARMLINAAFTGSGPLGFLFGGGGPSGAPGGLTGLLASLFAPRASGGPVSRGAPYLVGERGPELMIPRNSGQIISSARTRAMLGRQNDAPAQLNLTVTGASGDEHVRRLARQGAQEVVAAYNAGLRRRLADGDRRRLPMGAV